MFSGSSRGKIGKFRALLDAYKVITLADKLDAEAHLKAGYEVQRGQCKKILKSCKLEAEKAKVPRDTIEILREGINSLNKVKLDKSIHPIEIAIIGEIYTIIEPFANMNIEDKLMDLGVSTTRKLTPTWWVNNTLLSIFNMDEIDIRRASKKYLPLCIGGHAQECIGEAVIAERSKADGAIQIFPLGCMPEIVSKSILPQISSDKNFPIMNLVVDELSGEGGFDTRIEAFVDLLERRKRKNVLYGY